MCVITVQQSTKRSPLQVKAASISTSGGQAARAELGLGDDFYDTSAGQRERMLQSTERLNKTGDRIRQGRQQLLETEVCPPIQRGHASGLHPLLASCLRTGNPVHLQSHTSKCSMK